MAHVDTKNHDYHIIDPSPWPLLSSIGIFLIAIGGITYMHSLNGGLGISVLGLDLYGPWLFFLGLTVIFYTMYGWWGDTIKEAGSGDHTPVVSLHLRYGMILFIASEVMFFVAWFWAFFDAALFAGDPHQFARFEYTGGQWPPTSIEGLEPLHLPLFNTVTLLLSGTTLTWSHHAFLQEDRKSTIYGLFLTVILGIIFLSVQILEYVNAPFSFSESLYGATFFMATGFHGFHVLVGTIFLIVCLVRAKMGHFSQKNHFGFEAASWYWHFVDVVWLFLFFSFYIWPSKGLIFSP
ncbi:cytochrome c oxidase subunit 3 [Candidatus Endowatersipora endosymbiont of Watersipora subatra]|uniref:cytochrome c oxidase subunit 3 n=1 Tax=Candidatus Endowatersipora endosymbiont of Watersipora subatra TaxID=3077946 RepID=UPI00312CA5AD